MSDILSESAKIVGNWIGPLLGAAKEQGERIVVREVQTLMPLQGQIFVRLAGLSGALAVSLGAYGAHAFKGNPDMKLVYETGNRYHMLHTIVLLAVPLTRRPKLVGTLMLTGMTIFSGSCYYHALTGNTTIRRFTPYGGMLLIAAWVSMML